MTHLTNYATVHVDFGRGKVLTNLCVPLDRGVPPELRCVPGGAGPVVGAGGDFPPLPTDLKQRVDHELRLNLERSKRQGYVLVKA